MEQQRKLSREVYKTGQRVPVGGHYVDQHGYVSRHERHKTFPPCIGASGECAHRRLIISW